MAEPMDARDFAGPHPTCGEFVAQLATWGFTERGEDHVHTVFRGPHGGTLRVLRADPALAEKAARLAGVTPAHFWAGPEPAPAPESAQEVPRPRAAARRRPAARDSVVALVLSVHAEADRPLGFDQVAELSGNRVTRTQVSAASAALCRGGQLDRIRSGVYQWSAGRRAARRVPAARRADALPPEPPATRPGSVSAAELFGQLFPAGVQMTGELLGDLEQWARLTGKLAAHGGAAS
ncbi:MAG: hypothetical protein ACRDOH_21110 [Streptosporangiaceae bacterium]